ncbi:hypothetical protein R5R35_001279 [Gryllus longicercus]|uniref:Ribosome production factor 2 homolog n=1 Tax=Gryllus longicercus TaxID=2509291 RepID=A0AAN9VM15_9ORTH
MGAIQRIRQPTTGKGKRFLKSRAPKAVENTKRTLFLRGPKSSQTVVECMKDFCRLKKPHGTFLNRKTDWRPFEDVSKLEFFSKKYDSSLFMFASHNKKRPNNLIIGRTYDHQLLDMIELGVNNFKNIETFKTEKVSYGTKPCLLFCGDEFEYNFEYQRLKSLLIDLFQYEVMEFVRLQGIQHVIMFTATKDTIYMRSYRILFKKSGSRTPRVELEEIGPSLDFNMRRTKLASEDLYKLACKKPKELKVKKVKNIDTNPLGTTHGRIHIPKQNINKLQTRKMKGLRKTPAEKRAKRKDKAEKRTPKLGAKRAAAAKNTSRPGKKRKMNKK